MARKQKLGGRKTYLVNDHVTPSEFAKSILFDVADLICGDDDVPGAVFVPHSRFELIRDNALACWFVPVEPNGFKRWSPASEFVHPIGESALGDNDEMRTRYISILFHIYEDGYRLERLSKAPGTLVRCESLSNG